MIGKLKSFRVQVGSLAYPIDEYSPVRMSRLLNSIKEFILTIPNEMEINVDSSVNSIQEAIINSDAFFARLEYKGELTPRRYKVSLDDTTYWTKEVITKAEQTIDSLMQEIVDQINEY